MKKIVIAVFALVICGLLAGCSQKTAVNMEDITVVTVYGQDGEGVASAAVSFDILGAELEDLAKYMPFYAGVNYSLSKSEGLSNGEEIEVTVNYSAETAKECGLAVSGTSFSYTVQGLTEAQPYDAFENLVVSFVGTSPLCGAEFTNNAADAFGASIRYSVDNNWSLRDGDTVTVTASAPSSHAAQEYYISEETREYTVDCGECFVETGADLTAGVMAALEKEATDHIEADLAVGRYLLDWALLQPGDRYFADMDAAQFTTPQYEDASVLFGKPERLAKGSRLNFVILFYKTTVSNFTQYTDGETQDIYVAVEFLDVVIHKDGTVRYEDVYIANAAGSYDELYSAIVTARADEYEHNDVN